MRNKKEQKQATKIDDIKQQSSANLCIAGLSREETESKGEAKKEASNKSINGDEKRNEIRDRKS